MSACLQVCACSTCMQGQRRTDGASDPLRLESQMVVRCYLGAGNKPGSSGGTTALMITE